jgi:hypothetical protein
MDDRQNIEWVLHAKKLLLHLEKRQMLSTNHPYVVAKLDWEIAAVEQLIGSCRQLFINRRLESSYSQLASPTDWAVFLVAHHELGRNIPVQ